MKAPLLASAGEVALVVVVLTIATLGLRYGWLLARARSPRVQLAPVAQAARRAGEKEVNPQWVGSLLREELARLRLSASEAIPDASAGTPLLEIVEGIGEGIGDKSQLGRAVGRLFRAIFPEAAYEVSATLRPAAGEGGTISLQVVDRTHRHRTWVGTGSDDRSWHEAARMAAAGVAGALYPQVGERHKGPWASWRRPVPAKLVILNDEARRHEKHNRLEQAMGAYHEALDRDPLNPGLRLRIAMLQERLELHLGAWATYRAIADETHRDSWKSVNRRARLLALYRMAILLGNQKVASRWLHGAEDPSEEARKSELRRALKAERHLIRASWWKRFTTLARMFPVEFVGTSPSRLLDTLGHSDGTDAVPTLHPGRYEDARRTRGEWLLRQLERDTKEWPWETFERIRGILEVVSLTHLEQLDTRLRRKPPWRPWRWIDWWRYRPPVRHLLRARELSLSAVRVSKLVARIRIVESARIDSTASDLTRSKAGWARGRLLLRWPFAPRPWRRPVRWLRPRHRVADRRDDAWQFHYNAACAVSRMLSPDAHSRNAITNPSESKLVAAGIRQLEEYVHRAGGELLRTQADWIARDDDDLVALRRTEQYRQWRRHHLPEMKGKGAPARRLNTTRIAARIAHSGALTFAERWRARAIGKSVTFEMIADWWAREASAWQLLIQLFDGHVSWEERWQSINGLQLCLRTEDEVVAIEGAHRAKDGESERDLTCLLNGLCGRGEDTEWSPGVDLVSIGRWAKKKADSALAQRESPSGVRAPSLRALREEARRTAKLWHGLADMLESELCGSRPTPSELTVEYLREVENEISPASPVPA
jgi:tetratricopeptide (TPR) repeat protein